MTAFIRPLPTNVHSGTTTTVALTENNHLSWLNPTTFDALTVDTAACLRRLFRSLPYFLCCTTNLASMLAWVLSFRYVFNICVVGFLRFFFSFGASSLIHSRLFLPILKQDIFDYVTGFSESLLLEYMESSFVVFWGTLGRRSMMNFYLYHTCVFFILSYPFRSAVIFLNLLFPFLYDLDGY